MNLIDKIRIEYAVQKYDYWLELRGTRGRVRKALRRDLRDNLRAATADVGVTQALFNIGSPKQLAYEMTPEAERRPRFSLGAMWATVTFGAVLYTLMFTSIAFVSGVEASGVTGREVTGDVFPWIGVRFIATVLPGGHGLSTGAANAQWYLLGLPLLVFVLVSKPWRLLTERKEAAAAHPA